MNDNISFYIGMATNSIRMGEPAKIRGVVCLYENAMDMAPYFELEYADGYICYSLVNDHENYKIVSEDIVSQKYFIPQGE